MPAMQMKHFLLVFGLCFVPLSIEAAETSHEMARDQLSDSVSEDMRRRARPVWIQQGYTEPQGYGLGVATYGAGSYGHPGAYKTQLKIDPVRGIVLVWMIQYADLSGNASNSWPTFEAAALATYAPK